MNVCEDVSFNLIFDLFNPWLFPVVVIMMHLLFHLFPVCRHCSPGPDRGPADRTRGAPTAAAEKHQESAEEEVGDGDQDEGEDVGALVAVDGAGLVVEVGVRAVNVDGTDDEPDQAECRALDKRFFLTHVFSPSKNHLLLPRYRRP